MSCDLVELGITCWHQRRETLLGWRPSLLGWRPSLLYRYGIVIQEQLVEELWVLSAGIKKEPSCRLPTILCQQVDRDVCHFQLPERMVTYGEGPGPLEVRSRQSTC